MQSALETFADFALAFRAETAPQSVRDKVKTCIVDVLWGCLQVHHDVRAKACVKVMNLGHGLAASVLTSAHRATAMDAAYINAAACAATDRSDTHLPTATHPGIIVIPAVLAALQERGGTGADLERGVIVGYEIMCRIARAVQSPAFAAIYRPTAVVAPVAAAIAVATALGFERKAIITAGSLAAHTAIGFNEWARAGTGEHVFHAGVAARSAVTCAYLGAEGVAAATTMMEGPSGLLAGFAALDKVDRLTSELGTRFEMDEIAFKPAPACFFAQTPVQTAASFQTRIDPDTIDSIDIHVTSTAEAYPGCSAAAGIDSVQAAVMSIPFAVASTLRAGGLNESAWFDFAEPKTLDLASRCRVVADDDLSVSYPKKSGTRIVVRTRDGGEITAFRDDFISMDGEAVRSRFLSDANRWIGADQAARLLRAAERLETLPDVSEFTIRLEPVAATVLELSRR
jgi:2-methylcitrate dehydratase PrpD